MEIPEILDCACIGVNDEQTGEKLIAFVVCNNQPDISQIREHCKNKLAAYKIPKEFIQTSTIPKSGIGKTSRYILKKTYHT